MNARDIAKRYGMLSVDEVDLIQVCVGLFDPYYYELASNQPLIIVNIGANVGTSACAILEANPRAFVFSIDIKPCPEEQESLIACGLPHNQVVRLLGDSAEIGKSFPYDVDMVFIDGAHHDESVRGDIKAWIPKCKHIALFHDYHHPRYKDKPGVNLDAIVDEAMKEWGRLGEARYLVGFKRI